MTRLSEAELAGLLRSFFMAYRARFDALAPDVGPVPVLERQELDVVRVNGGRALHFFFTSGSEPVGRRGATRLHDVEVHPSSTAELKAVAERSPGKHRDQVRRVADISGALYLHFILWPEDGAMVEVLGEVAGTVAEREVRRAQGEALEDDVPATDLTGGDGSDWIQPAP